MDIWWILAEKRIQEAYERGEFDKLEGFGKPIDNSDYFSVPAEERMAFHILKNAGALPEEMQIRKDIYHMAEQIKHTIDPEERTALMKKREFLEDQLLLLKERKKDNMR